MIIEWRCVDHFDEIWLFWESQTFLMRRRVSCLPLLMFSNGADGHILMVVMCSDLMAAIQTVKNGYVSIFIMLQSHEQHSHT